MGKKGDLSDFERGMVVVARWAGLSTSETGQKCLVDVRGQRRMGRLVRDDSSTVTRITTRYNQGMQKTISECTTR